MTTECSVRSSTSADQRRAVGDFTPLAPVNLAELRDILVLGGIEVSYEAVKALVRKGPPEEDDCAEVATDKVLDACVPWVRGKKICDVRVRNIVADGFRMVRDYHRDMRRPLSYDLGDAPVAAEQTFYMLFKAVHEITDICCPVAPESHLIAKKAYGDMLAELWKKIGSVFPDVPFGLLTGAGSALDAQLIAHRAQLGEGVYQHIHRTVSLLDKPRVFLHILSGVHAEVEVALRYRDLIAVGCDLRERRASETHERPMIMAHIQRKNFLARRLFY